MYLANTKINHIYFCVSLDLYYLVECVFAYRCLFTYLQYAHADGLFDNGSHFEEER